YIKLADGSTFQGLDEDIAKAVASYSAKTGNGFDFSNIRVSPEVTKIVEKVPVEIEKIVEKTVQVPVLPERPLTQNEINFLKEMKRMSYKQRNRDAIIGIGVTVGLIGALGAYAYYLNKRC
ncbi:MAG: hypothetical protein J6U54_24285, partial [Clostridiales bacterium]|nr:hypothetical protein [Clostridiales bacterium]